MRAIHHVAPRGGEPTVFATVTFPASDPPGYIEIGDVSYVQEMGCSDVGGDGAFGCSLCGARMEGATMVRGEVRFCPNCGARVGKRRDAS